MTDPVVRPQARPVDVLHVSPAHRDVRGDVVAAEEPLEIRLQGTSFVVTMRTPGDDYHLAAGFLLAERIITAGADVHSISHCPDTPDFGNILDVTLTGEALNRATSALAHRRLVSVTSACGVCGRRSIDDLMTAEIVARPGEQAADGPGDFLDGRGGVHRGSLYLCRATA